MQRNNSEIISVLQYLWVKTIGFKGILYLSFGLLLLNDVRHQAQVSLDEDVPGLLVALGIALETRPLLRGGKGLWKRPTSRQPQGEQQRIGKQQ